MKGRFYIVREQNHLDNALKELSAIVPDEKKPLAVKIEPYKKNRSQLQNALLWGWVYAQLAKLLEEGGVVMRLDDGGEMPWTVDVIHEAMKQMYGKRAAPITTVRRGKRRTLEFSPSTTNMTTSEFSEYIENIKKFSWQFWQVQIPDPPVRSIFAEYAKELNA